MEKEVHIKIAKVLFKNVCLPEEFEVFFIEGITAPDKWRHRNPRLRHHCVSGSRIFYYIMNARSFYIRGDLRSCLYNLGIALHYIQDAYIPSPRTKFRRRIHASLEKSMKNLSIPHEEVSAGFSLANSSPKFVKKVISEIKWVYDPKVALGNAVKTSATIMAAVFGPKELPEGFQAKYAIAKREHRKYIVTGWLTFLTGFLTGAFMWIIIHQLLSLLVLIISIIISLAIVRSDERFYELEEEASWYGISD